MDGNPSGVRKLMSASSAEALRASEVSVRTTPFTCGCQASVAINIRIMGTRDSMILNFLTLRTWIFQAYDVIDL
jgi:hypothetical protein